MHTTSEPAASVTLPDIDKVLAGCVSEPCTRCGTGRKEINHQKVGQRLRAYRERHGLSQREVARRMEQTAAYVGDLELGRRPWNAQRVGDYLAACKRRPR